MRTIKFRVWNGEQMVSPDYITRDGYAHWKEDSIPQSSNQLMQFTGLYDREGNEVWEGDIMSNNHGTDMEVIRQVIFHQGSWVMRRVKGTSTFKNEIPLFDYCLLNFKILGNIHEHPYLLNNGNSKD